MRILRPKDAASKVGLSRAHLYRLERAGQFPRRIRLGPASVGWIEDDLEEWIRSRVSDHEVERDDEKKA